MFGFFKRTKVEDWEIQLLSNCLSVLSGEYKLLTRQINDGLFRSVLLDASDIPGYVAFGFNYDVYKKYFRESEKSYKLSNIKVFDSKTSSYLPLTIFISGGIINGYSIYSDKKFKIEPDRIDLSGFKRESIFESDYDRIADLFKPEVKEILNPSEVYSIIISGKEYFHIKDLEDGDFIGIDEHGNTYKITHDPPEVILLQEKLIDILKSQ